MSKRLTSRQITEQHGISNGALGRLFASGAIEREKVRGLYVYKVERVLLAVKERDARTVKRQSSVKGKPRKYGRGKAADIDKTPNWATDGKQAPVGSFAQREPDAKRGKFYPETGGSALAYFAGVN